MATPMLFHPETRAELQHIYTTVWYYCPVNAKHLRHLSLFLLAERGGERYWNQQKKPFRSLLDWHTLFLFFAHRKLLKAQNDDAGSTVVPKLIR